MKHNPANPSDVQISRMVQALREDPMPSAPVALYTQTRSRVAASGARRTAWSLLGVGSCAAVALAVVLAPKPSAAAALKRLVQASSSTPCRTFAYTQLPDGAWKMIGEYYVGGDRFHGVPHGGEAEVFIDGHKRYDLWRDRGFATESTFDPAKSEAFFSDASLKSMLDLKSVKSVSRTPNVSWHGRTLDRFDYTFEYRRKGQKLIADATIYADANTDLPYYQQCQMEGYPPMATEWQYPADAEAKLKVDLPIGTRVYDMESQRPAAKQALTGVLASDVVDGVKVTLRAVYVDEWGGIEVATTGGSGLAGRPSAGIRVDGKNASNSTSEAYGPLSYRGLDLVFLRGEFGRDFRFPQTFDLQVPIWKAAQNRGSASGNVLVGFARFHSVAPMRTASIAELLSPANRFMLNPATSASDATRSGPAAARR